MTITWDKSLATGSLTIDHQHQELFRKVNILTDAMKQGKGRDVIETLLDSLWQSVVRHFAEEERLMEKLHCPAAVANKQAHAQFLSKYNGLQIEFDGAEAGPSLALQIQNLFSKWLLQHISGIDVQLQECWVMKAGPRWDHEVIGLGSSRGRCSATEQGAVLARCPTGQFDEFKSLQTGIFQWVDSGLWEVMLPVQAGEAKERNANRPQTHVGLLACQLCWGGS